MNYTIYLFWVLYVYIDTVEAYESGELAKLLGVAARDISDLWANAVSADLI